MRGLIKHPALGVALFALCALTLAKYASDVYGKNVQTLDQLSLAESSDENKNLRRSKERCEKDTGCGAYSDLNAQWVMAVGTFAIVFLTGVGVWILSRTLRETEKAAEYAGKTLKEAERATQAALETVAQAAETSKLELRARLSVEPKGISQLIATDLGMGHVALRNIGKLPARNVSLEVRMMLHGDQNFKEFPVREDGNNIPRVIQPGTEMKQGSEDKLPLSALCNPGKNVFVWGVAYYDDGYKKRRFTRFCHRYSTASHNREAAMTSLRYKALGVIDTEKARFHAHGNDAD